ncbi:MAG TPA: radical SAM protein [Desulfobulbus sp.]|nr:radical SAM protein [Desulfobulbus sp.]
MNSALSTAGAIPLVIPVFIPHEGCPHSCVFCNQHRISGIQGKPLSADDVTRITRTWLERDRKKNRCRVQVAFYGGSFTGLALSRQQELLAAVLPFIRNGAVQAIRCSTRPDSIDAVIVNFLYARHVRVVELGGQSLDDSVLQNSRRGHSAADVVQASTMLKNAGMELGIQLMVGLPGQNFSSLRGTTDQVVSLAPDFVRIYPVLVVAGSGLARWYKRGEYRPLTLTRAVLQTAWMKKKLMAAGIRVVRMGLQPGRDLEKALLAGPYHPAFGELVNARLMLQQTRKLLSGVGPGQKVLIGISNRDLSVFKGIRQANIQRLTRLGLFDRFTLQTDPQQPRGTMKLITPD